MTMETINERPARKKVRLSPALALWLLAPVFGELVSGATPLNEYLNPVTILVFGMLYGSGALLIRECILRFKKGWISLLLLGMAYGIYEEGLVVRSFFDPNWMDLGKLGIYGRIWGTNWFWIEELMIYHALFSITAGVALIEMLYPERRQASWLGKRGLILNAILFLATLPIGYLLDSYQAPLSHLFISVLAILGLSAVALLLPGKLREVPSRQAPRPRRFWWIGFLGTTAFFLFIYVTADHEKPHFILSMIILAVFCLILQSLILHWNGNGYHWDDRHRLALMCGAFCFFLILGTLINGSQAPVLYFTNPVYLMLFWLAYRRVEKRVKGEKTYSPMTPQA